jgi:hypothetical protein
LHHAPLVWILTQLQPLLFVHQNALVDVTGSHPRNTV